MRSRTSRTSQLCRSNNFVFSLILLAVACIQITETSAQVNQINHLYATSQAPQKLFSFFNKEFGLPVVWDSWVRGRYASAAVWFGNTAVEFVSGDSGKKAQFEGIALEPLQSMAAMMTSLDNNRVPHDTCQSYSFNVVDKGHPQEKIGWTTLDLINIFPPEMDFYIIQYENKKRFDLNRAIANDSLKISDGGPLGIVSLERIIVSTNRSDSCRQVLGKIPGIRVKENGVFGFNQGSAIQIIDPTKDGNRPSDTGIIKIIVRVRSLDIAVRYLTKKNMIGRQSEHSVYIDPLAIEGLQVELVDQ